MQRLIQDITVENRTREGGLPDGGTYTVFTPAGAPCLTMVWQRGPLVDPATGLSQPPNGLFLETALRACRERLRYYQEETKFSSPENVAALESLNLSLHHLETAIDQLVKRAERRAAEGTLGTHEPDKT